MKIIIRLSRLNIFEKFFFFCVGKYQKYKKVYL